MDVEIIKLGFGSNGTYTDDVSRSVPLPVDSLINVDLMQSGANQMAPKFKYVNLTADADLIALVTSKKILVLALHVDEQDQTADVILTVRDDNVSGTVLAEFAGMDLQAKGLGFSPVGWFETASGKALFGDVTGTTPDLNICIVYVEVA